MADVDFSMNERRGKELRVTECSVKRVGNPCKRETKVRQGEGCRRCRRRRHYVHFLFPLHYSRGKTTRQSK